MGAWKKYDRDGRSLDGLADCWHASSTTQTGTLQGGPGRGQTGTHPAVWLCLASNSRGISRWFAVQTSNQTFGSCLVGPTLIWWVPWHLAGSDSDQSSWQAAGCEPPRRAAWTKSKEATSSRHICLTPGWLADYTRSLCLSAGFFILLHSAIGDEYIYFTTSDHSKSLEVRRRRRLLLWMRPANTHKSPRDVATGHVWLIIWWLMQT